TLKIGVMPGTGYPSERFANELLGVSVAILAFDGDAEGRAKTLEVARVAGVPCHDLDLPDGLDLAECLRELAPDERSRWLHARLRNARPVELPEPHSPPGAGRRLILTRASAIRSEPARWLWRTRIPLRGLTAVAGEKGLGKSLLTNALLVADVSRGRLEGELF